MKLKSILPFDRYTLTTNLSEAEVLKRLGDNVDTQRKISTVGVSRWGSNTSLDKPYAGTIKNNQFEIARILVNSKNSFLPMIKGEISVFLGKTEVKIKMSPHIAVLIFSVFWMVMVIFACVVVSSLLISDPNTMLSNPALFIPFGMFIFGCLLFTLPYKYEAKKSRKFLAALLDGEETENL